MEDIMPGLIEEYLEKKEKEEKAEERSEISSQDESLLYDAREYLGYAVKKSDPEFRAMKAKHTAKAKERKSSKGPSAKSLLKQKVAAALKERESEK